jgi:phosphoglycerate dehydrogenase-like enzyme
MLPNVILDEAALSYSHMLQALGCLEKFETHDDVSPSLTDCNILLANAAMAEAFLRAGHRANWIQSTWAGNAALIPLLQQTETCLTGVKGVFGPLVAEYVFSYILPEIRDTSRLEKAQIAHRWDLFEPRTLQDKVFVFIGTGSIGSHVARIAKLFGMSTVGVSRSGLTKEGYDQVYPVTRLRQAVATADYILLSVPETPETFRLVNKAVLDEVKQGATLINVGRGSTLDIGSMANAIHEGRLGAAILDVFDEEPLPTSHPLWDSPRVTITPHLAAISNPQVVVKKFMNNLKHYRRGEELEDRIDLTKGY